MRRYIILLITVILILSLTTEMYNVLSVVLTVCVLYCMLDKFGKGIVLLETMAFYSCVIYLMMPLLGYAVYNRQNHLSVLWHKVMPVPFETYYSFILPAICTYLLGLFLLNYLARGLDEGENMHRLSTRIRAHLSQPGNKGISLIVAGLLFYFIKVVVPGPLAAVASFGYLIMFTGLLYVYFQPKFRGKIWIYMIVAVFLMRDALNSGMFTVTFYMSITIVSFFLVGKKIRFPVKLAAIVGAVCALFVLQLVKNSFRNSTSHGKYTGSKAELFQDLVIEKTGTLNNILSPTAFFPVFIRLNQGYQTALVLRRIPAIQPYDGGSSIGMTVAASIVPRILWPDKPEAGGIYNMKHFAGFSLRGWSANIGPVGEAYGNFGPGGGIVYMFVFGLFIGWAYVLMFRLSRNMPMIVLWIPLLFFEVMYSMENDTLQALNSIIKAAFFLWVLYKLFPDFFNDRKTRNRSKAHQGSPQLRHARRE